MVWLVRTNFPVKVQMDERGGITDNFSAGGGSGANGGRSCPLRCSWGLKAAWQSLLTTQLWQHTVQTASHIALTDRRLTRPSRLTWAGVGRLLLRGDGLQVRGWHPTLRPRRQKSSVPPSVAPDPQHLHRLPLCQTQFCWVHCYVVP